MSRYGEYFKSRDANSFDLDDEQYRSSQGPLSRNNVLWSGLVGFALKGQKHRLSILKMGKGRVNSLSSGWLG